MNGAMQESITPPLTARTVRIRQARRDDAAAVAPLLLAAGALPLRYVFGLGDDALALGFLRAAFCYEDSPFSFRHVVVASIDGEIVGVASGYPSIDMPRHRRTMSALILKHYKPAQWLAVGRRGLAMKKHAGGIGTDVFYCSGLAVAPEHRRRGLGRMLTDGNLAQARVNHLTVCQLHVSTQNPTAQRLFERCGFIGMRTFEHAQMQDEAGMGPEILMQRTV